MKDTIKISRVVIHQRKAEFSMYVINYEGKEIPSGYQVYSLDENGRREGRTAKRVSKTFTPICSNDGLFHFFASLYCLPNEVESSKSTLITYLKEKMESTIKDFNEITVKRFNEISSESMKNIEHIKDEGFRDVI